MRSDRETGYPALLLDALHQWAMLELRARFHAIACSPEAEYRGRLARHLVLETDVDVAAARVILARSPVDPRHTVLQTH